MKSNNKNLTPNKSSLLLVGTTKLDLVDFNHLFHSCVFIYLVYFYHILILYVFFMLPITQYVGPGHITVLYCITSLHET